MDGVLTISGTGEMLDYEEMPWSKHLELITALVIDDGVTLLDDNAFTGCVNLSSVDLPETLEMIPQEAFSSCASLESIVFPNSVTYIEWGAFLDCSSLVNVNFGNRVTDIDGFAFGNCTSLESLVIGNNVKIIHEAAFSGCTALTNVTIPNSVEEIWEVAFDGCNNLTEVTFEGSAPSIQSSAFYDVTTTAYYPANNPTWIEEVMQNYGGTLTWVSYEPEAEEIEKFNLTGITATFGNSLALNFVIDTAKLSGDGHYAVVTKEYADGRRTEATIRQSDWPVYSGNLRYFSFDGIAAKEMMDTVTAVVYNSKDQAVTNAYVTSLRDYCVKAWNQEAAKAAPDTDKLTQYIDMLNYGAAAQVKFGYDTGNLANADLTETQQSYATPDSAVTGENIFVKGTGCVGTTLTLVSQIELNFVFQNEVIDQASYAIATFTNHYGAAKEIRIETFPVYNSTMKYVPVSGMSAADCGNAVTLKLYDSEGNVLSTCVESMTSLCIRATSSNDLYWACLKYCQASYQYFH